MDWVELQWRRKTQRRDISFSISYSSYPQDLIRHRLAGWLFIENEFENVSTWNKQDGKCNGWIYFLGSLARGWSTCSSSVWGSTQMGESMIFWWYLILLGSNAYIISSPFIPILTLIISFSYLKTRTNPSKFSSISSVIVVGRVMRWVRKREERGNDIIILRQSSRIVSRWQGNSFSLCPEEALRFKWDWSLISRFV